MNSDAGVEYELEQLADDIRKFAPCRKLTPLENSVMAELDDLVAEFGPAWELDPEISYPGSRPSGDRDQSSLDASPGRMRDTRPREGGDTASSAGSEIPGADATFDQLRSGHGGETAEPGGETASQHVGGNGPEPLAPPHFPLAGSQHCLVEGGDDPSRTSSDAVLDLDQFLSWQTEVPPIAGSLRTPLRKDRKRDRHKNRPGPAQKFARSVEIARKKGGFAFTLRLSRRRERLLAGSPDPARSISDRINRALAQAGISEPCYAFVLETETATGQRPHLHGVLILNSGSDQDRFEGALRKAGGRIEGRSASTQLHLRRLDSRAYRWVSYTADSEVLAETSEFLGTKKIIFLSRRLKRAVLDDLDQRPAEVPLSALMSAP